VVRHPRHGACPALRDVFRIPNRLLMLRHVSK
jgi:hypothetical protein